jgi:hypothetical protein
MAKADTKNEGQLATEFTEEEDRRISVLSVNSVVTF